MPNIVVQLPLMHVLILVVSSIEESLQVMIIVHRSLGLGEYVTQILFTSDMCCTDYSCSNCLSDLVESNSIMFLFQCAGGKLCIDNDSLIITENG